MIDEYMKLFEIGKVDGVFLWVFLEQATPDARGYGILRWNQAAPASRKLGFYMYKSYQRTS
jgi:hypothetical protein